MDYTQGFIESTKQGFVLLSVYFFLMWELKSVFLLIIGKSVRIIKHAENRSTNLSTHHPKITTSNIFPQIFSMYIHSK